MKDDKFWIEASRYTSGNMSENSKQGFVPLLTNTEKQQLRDASAIFGISNARINANFEKLEHSLVGIE